jgi:glutathione-independent formaldehyde dehydrogenase
VAENRCVVYQGPNEVTIEDIGYPKLEVPEYVASNMGFSTQEAHHGVILRIVSTNICGSDQHMVRAERPRLRGRPGDTRSPAR